MTDLPPNWKHYLMEDYLDDEIRRAMRSVEIRESLERGALRRELRLALVRYVRHHNIGPAGHVTTDIIRQIDAHLKNLTKVSNARR